MNTHVAARKTFSDRLRFRLIGSSLRNEKGFTLVEVIIATFFVALLGITISMSFLKMTRSSIWNRESKKAASLADMVFERYVVYASSNFVNLSNFAVSSVTASAFFGTPDNLGYDNFQITTTISIPPGNANLRKVDLTLYCTSMSNSLPFNFTTYLSPLNTNVGGATVDVYVYTSPNAPNPNAPIAGAIVTAPQYQSAAMVTAITDATGHAYLQNVQTSGNGIIADVPITAAAAGSDSNIPQLSASYVPGYFVITGNGKNGQYSASQTLYANVQLHGTQPVNFKQFLPDYQLPGTVTDETTSTGAGGMQVQLHAPGILTGKSLSSALITVFTSTIPATAGQFEVNNLLPGTVQFNSLGIQGSAMTIPPTDPTYVQGYAGDATKNPTSFKIKYSQGSPLLLPAQNLYVVPEGSLAITTLDPLANPVPNTTVAFTVMANNVPTTISMATAGAGPTAGQLNLYNVIPYTQSVTFDASQTPSGKCGVPPMGAFGSLTQNCSAGQPSLAPTNTVTLVVNPGGEVDGQAWDSANGVGVPNLNVATLALDGVTPLTTTTDTSGNFKFCGVAPIVTGNKLNITFSNSTPVSGFFPNGTIVAKEYYDGQPVAGATLVNATVGACPGIAGSVVSDANGNFPAFCMNSNWQVTVAVNLTPPKSTLWNVGHINIDPNAVNIPLEADNYPYFNPGKTTVAVNGGIASGVTQIQPQLAYYPVIGTVQDLNTMSYLGGVNVTSNPNSTVSFSTGTYALIGRIKGRKLTPFNPGSVSATAGPGISTSNGFTYSSSSGNSPVAVPALFDLTVPLEIDFYLGTSGGGGTII